jgi:protein-S-isoprenylcysteine O-methyltransferase Ste14
MFVASKRFGIGPELFFAGAGVFGGALLLSRLAPEALRFPTAFRPALSSVGTALVAAGAFAYAWGLFALARCRRRGVLCVSGPYALCRHPLYAAWVLLIVPGVCLLSGVWPTLAAPAAMAAVFGLRVRREEAPLESRFGEAYARYRDRVPALVPRLQGRNL